MNPVGFNYCGFCATPMESTEMRAQIAELAAPPGGWPNLTSELVEVRFYLQQGLFDDAYELLSILQKRHPGHPQLSELARRPKAARRVDTGVMALVDAVLAESANLVAKVPRRAAPRFSAPAQGGSDRTDVHTVVPQEEEETQARRPKTGSQQSTRRSGSHPTTDGARPARSTRSTGANRTTAAEAAPEAPRREPTRIYRAVEPPSSTRGASRGAAERPGASEPARTAQRGEPSGARPVVQAPAIPAQHSPGARTAESSRAAAPAPARPVSQASSPVPARPVPQPTPPARTTRPPTGATEVRAAPKPETRAPAPAVTGRTVISKPPQTGHTVVVDALQAPAPYPEESRSSRGTRRRREEERPAEAAPAEPAAAAPEPPAEAAAPAAPKAEQPRRRASFGEHVLNRLR